MPSRKQRDDVDWDFSFVGEPVRSRDLGDASDDAEIDWDFSFVGEARPNDAVSARRTGQDERTDDVDWDFSFVGEARSAPATRRSAGGSAADGGDDMEWDFSFVTSDEPVRVSQSPRQANPADTVESAAEPRAESDDEPIEDIIVTQDLTGADDSVAFTPTEQVPTIVVSSTTDDFETVETDETGETVETGAAGGVEESGTDELIRSSLLDDLGADEPVSVSPDAEVIDPTPIVSHLPSDEPVKVLTICTHNRTRSVMMMALLQAGFDRSVGEGRVMVRSLGFGPEGEEPIADAVDEMADRGLDVSLHRSLQVTGPRVAPADLILTAERDHVAKIAEASPEAFRRTFTLPEFCTAIAGDPVPGSRSLREWLHSMSSSRSPATYLSGDVAEVDDPTGSPKRQFAAATETIESMCETVVDLLEVSVGRPNWRDGIADQV